MIFDYLIPKLRDQIPNRDLRVEMSPEARVVFPCVHPEVGDIEIHDDGDELTVYAGNFTHVHFSNYDEKLSKEQKAEQIAEDVVAFLNNLFADQVVLWGSHNGGGGWSKREEPDKLSFLSNIFPAHKKQYVWSGPLP